MKILAVEDDPVARRVLEASLILLGHEVVLAESGDEAWRVLETQPIRVVVSDWEMPSGNGLDLCERIRARKGDYVFFILLTNASANNQNQDAALAAGVDDFLN